MTTAENPSSTLPAASKTPTVLSSWALLVWRELQSQACDGHGIFKQAGLNADKLSDCNARYSLAAMQRLWPLAITASGRDDFALQAGQGWHPTTFHALGYAWLASSTLSEALQRLARYSRIVNSGMVVRYQPDTFGAQLIFNAVREDIYTHPGARDASLSTLLTMLRMLMGDNYSPDEICLLGSRPANAATLEQLARCPIIYHADESAVRFERSDLKRRLATGNPLLQQANDQLLIASLGELDKSDTVERVRQAIHEQLPSGEACEQAVAQALGLSVRNLQRKLAEQDCRFRDLFDSIRRELARQHLGNSQLSLNAIAYLLGFANQANFSRAFKRWQGLPPSEYRRQLLKTAA